MLHNHVQPKVRLDLLHHMREFARSDTLDRRVVTAERKEKINYAFADTRLFPTLVNVLAGREVKQEFSISVVFVLRLGHLGFECWVD